MKVWYRSRTVWAGILVALIGMLEQISQIPELPPQVLTVLGLLIVFLRLVTKEPVALRTEKKDD